MKLARLVTRRGRWLDQKYTVRPRNTESRTEWQRVWETFLDKRRGLTIGDHAPAVVLLFVDPAGAMEGVWQLGGEHQRRDCDARTQLTGHTISVPLGVTGCLRARSATPEGDEPPSGALPLRAP
jgi:hypothetical protein